MCFLVDACKIPYCQGTGGLTYVGMTFQVKKKTSLTDHWILHVATMTLKSCHF